MFLMWQSVISSILNNGRDPTLLSESKLINVGRVQMDAVRVSLGTSQDPPNESMPLILHQPLARQKMECVRTYLSSMQNSKNQLCGTVSKKKKGCGVGRGKSREGQRENLASVCAV